MHPLIETHRQQLLALAHRHGASSVRLFGSMARGDAHADSDVDLLVTLAPGTSALALGGLLLDAQQQLGRRVDVLTEPGLHVAFRDRVSRDAVPLESDVPWRSLAGFRHVVVHAYLGVGLGLIWSVVERDLPTLASALARMAESLGNTGPA